MTAQFKVALGLSLGLHGIALTGLPGAEPPAFDVERAPASVEVFLIPPPRPAPNIVSDQPVPEPERTPVPETPTVASETTPEPQAIISKEQRGAVAGVLPGYLRNPPPVYPTIARQRGEEGTVLLEVEVLPTGRCGAVRVLASSGHHVLDEAASRAIRKWLFKPAKRWRQPVGFMVEIPITFRLEDGDGAVGF